MLFRFSVVNGFYVLKQNILTVKQAGLEIEVVKDEKQVFDSILQSIGFWPKSSGQWLFPRELFK